MSLQHWCRWLAGARRPRKHRRPGRCARVRPNLQILEDRTLLATAGPPIFVVTTTVDNGNNANPTPGSLRAAILLADSATGGSDIDFRLSANDPNHFYYRDDGVGGQVSATNIATTTASDDSTIADIDPDWAHSWWSFQPTSQLPDISQPVTIDGYTQSGASPNSNGPGLGTMPSCASS